MNRTACQGLLVRQFFFFWRDITVQGVSELLHLHTSLVCEISVKRWKYEKLSVRIKKESKVLKDLEENSNR